MTGAGPSAAAINRDRRALAAADVLSPGREWPHDCDTMDGRGAPCWAVLAEIAALFGDAAAAARFLRRLDSGASHRELHAHFSAEASRADPGCRLGDAIPLMLREAGWRPLAAGEPRMPLDALTGSGWLSALVDGAWEAAVHSRRMPFVCYVAADGQALLTWRRRRLRPARPDPSASRRAWRAGG